ncbi:MAG: hypothetical protein SFY66_11255 [Oculatellaceae cyanobacterium bins.114]|nr:hypothetical protein [Oculatellaceae cyanobacterium bins.114]
MRVENLTTRKNEDRFRVSATMIWEDRDRPSQEIFFETTSDFADDLSCNPHAFLVGTVITALRFGERRIAIDADICPQLLEGLFTIMSWFRHWEGLNLPLVEIEARSQISIQNSQKPKNAAVCYSGGIDSLATLRNNRLRFSLSHPRSFKDGLLIHGIANTTLEGYEKAVQRLSPVADDAGITLIPIYTNTYHCVQDLEDSNYTFLRYYLTSAALSAVGHAFHKRLSSLSISASDDVRTLTLSLWGTNPVLDPNYSSYDFQIHYADVALSRLEKTRLVAGWDIALQNLRVCNELHLPIGYLNCGMCRKCMITMTTLCALGVLDKTNVFPRKDISKALLLDRGRSQFPDEIDCYSDLIPLFKEQGRDDLVKGTEQLVSQFYQRYALKEFDQQYFNGVFYKLYQSIQKKKITQRERV